MIEDNIVRVPRWLIRKAWERGGIRLVKPTPFENTIVKVPVVNIKTIGFLKVGPTKKDAPQVHVNNSHTIVLTDDRLNFEHWEYRFWQVDLVNWQPMCTACRNCGKVFGPTQSAARRKHSNEKDCFEVLTEAYKLLLKDMKCVICDKYTEHKPWGVPICKTTMCMDEWMHHEPQPNSLLAALSLSSLGRTEASY